MPVLAPILPYIAIAASVASAAYSMYLTNNINSGNKRSDSGTLVNKRGTNATRDVVYGECLTGATAVYSNVLNAQSDKRLDVFGCAVGVSNILQAYIDDVSVLETQQRYREFGNDVKQLCFFDPSVFDDEVFNEYVATGNLKNGFERQCLIQLRTGISDYVSSKGLPIGIPMGAAMEYSDGEWTEEHRGDYVASIAVLTKRIIDSDFIRIAAPTFRVNLLVEGVPVHDPRFYNDRTVKHYVDFTVPEANRYPGRNPALAMLDYLTNTYYGLGLSYNDIDIESFKQTATFCDNNKFYIDGQLNQGDSFATNIDAIAKCAGLKACIVNGKLVLLHETIGLPSFAFDDSNILNKTLRVKEQSTDEYINVIEAEYKNSSLLDKSDIFTIPANLYPLSDDPAYPTQPQKDGYVAQGKIALPMVRFDGNKINEVDSQIKYLASLELNKQRYQKEVSFEIDYSECDIEVYDIITVTNIERGWVNKEFRVLSIKSKFDDENYNIAMLTAREHSNDMYLDTLDGTIGSQEPEKDFDIVPPTNLSFSQYYGEAKDSGVLTWEKTWFENGCDFTVEYKKSTSNAWTRVGRTSETSWDFPLLQKDTYDFRVRTNSLLYGSSDYATLNNVEILAYYTLPAVTGVTCDFTSRNANFTWNNMLDEAVSVSSNANDYIKSIENPTVRDFFLHYQVDLFHGETYVDTIYTTTNSLFYNFEDNRKNGISRSVRADVYIVSQDNTRSQKALGSYFLAVNTQHAQLSGFTADSELGVVNLSWTEDVELDYHSTQIRRREVDGAWEYMNVIGSSFVDILPKEADSNKVFEYQVSARDIFGDDNRNWSVLLQVTKSSIDDLRPEFNDELAALRDPDYVDGEGELTLGIASPNKKKMAGIGLFAKDEGDTKFIVAADEIVFSAGGYTEYDPTVKYYNGDRVTLTISATEQKLYRCTVFNTGAPLTDTNYWTLELENTFQAAFYFNTIDQKMYLKDAVIEKLNADKITVGTLSADRIAANSIKGDKIKADTTITVGVTKTAAEYEALLPDISLGTIYPDAAVHFHDTGASNSDGTGYYYAGVVVNLNNVNYGDLHYPSSQLEYLDSGDDAYISQIFTTIQDDYSAGEVIGVRNPDGTTTYTNFKNRHSYMTLRTTFHSGNIPNYDTAQAPTALYVYIEETGKRCVFNKVSYNAYEASYECNDPIFLITDNGVRYTIRISDNPSFDELYKPEKEAVVVLNGDDNISDKRFWAGNTNPELANISIDGDGVLRAKNAIIEGEVNATSGSFSGTLAGATFDGELINGTEINASLFKAGTIIASTIYASDTEILADPNDDGLPTYYVNYPSIPVSVLPQVSTATQRTLPANPAYIRSDLRSAADRWGEVNEIRARELIVPANAYRLTYNQNDVFSLPVYNGDTYVDWKDPILSVRLVDPDTGAVIASGSHTLVTNDTGAFITYSGGITLAGVTWVYSGKANRYLAFNKPYVGAVYKLENVVITNEAFTFGDVNNEELNGVYEISLHLPQQYYSGIAMKGNIYKDAFKLTTFVDNEA